MVERQIINSNYFKNFLFSRYFLKFNEKILIFFFWLGCFFYGGWEMLPCYPVDDGYIRSQRVPVVDG